MASPGRSHRQGITLLELAGRLPDEASAQNWFEKVHWSDGNLCCLRCGSTNVYRCKHKTMPFRCRDCKKYFSVKTGTAMEASNPAFEEMGLDDISGLNSAQAYQYGFTR